MFCFQDVKLIGDCCFNDSLLVRKQGMTSLHELLRERPLDKNVQSEFLRSILPLVCDRESTAQEKCVNICADVMLKNVVPLQRSVKVKLMLCLVDKTLSISIVSKTRNWWLCWLNVRVCDCQSNTTLVKLLIEEGSLVSTELDNERRNILHIMATQCMTNQHTDMLKLFSVGCDVIVATSRLGHMHDKSSYACTCTSILLWLSSPSKL